jgi:putative drug exporter of the RND superfamily
MSLLVFGAVAVALSLIGLGISSSLSPTITVVPGTQSSRAQHLADAHFGPSVLVPIMLEGPAQQLDRQGPVLVRALAARSDTRVLSAWDAGAAGKQLRPRPTAATIVASVAATEKQMVNHKEAQIERLVHSKISGPVHVSITGQPSIDRAMKSHAIDLARARMALAIPIIFLVLVLLLRAPVAAFALTALGAGTGYSAAGLTALLAKGMDVDALTLVLGMTTGFALASGYGFMYYRRWRSELTADRAHHDAAHAATAALGGVGRAVLVGGTALLAARASAALFGPTKVLSSLYITAVLASTLAIGAAVVVMPAALVLLGDRAQWLSFGAPRVLVRAWNRLVAGGGFAVRHATVFGVLVVAGLVALAVPLLSIDTGPPSAKFLPKGDQARVAYERVAQVMGPGWPTPYNIVVYSPKRPITDRALLGQIDRFQSQLASDHRVASVVGPGEFTSVSKQLGALPAGLKDSSKLLKGGKKQLGVLESGLGDAAAGAATLRSGLSEAASGANAGASGASQIHAGLGQARAGAASVTANLNKALDAARKLRDGAAQALAGSKKIASNLGTAANAGKAGVPIVSQMAANVNTSSDAVKNAVGATSALNQQLAAAAAEVAKLPDGPGKTAAAGAIASAASAGGGLESSLSSTSNTLSGAAGVASAVASQLGQLSTGLGQLYAGSNELSAGIAKLSAGNAQLAAGIDEFAAKSPELTAGIRKLEAGAGQLETGLGQLGGGLSGGVGPAGTLASGLGTATSKVAKFRSSLPSTKDLEQLQAQSPGLFDSGYFVLAAIQGAQPGPRNQASFAVNLNGGGNAGQITVISRYAFESQAGQQLGKDLSERVDAFAHRSGTQVALGGPAASLGDFLNEGKSSILPVVLGVTAVVLLLLMALVRAVVAPIVVVVLDLLGVAAAFGIMALLFSGHDPVFGGLGYIDPVSMIAGFTAAFGSLVFFQSQLLLAAREKFMRTGDAEGAVRHGLRSVAAGTTGVAVVWIATIIPSALSNVITIRQVAVADGLGILVATLLVRPVLLPAVMKLIGPRAWWPAHRPAAPTPAAPPPATNGHVRTPPAPVGGGRWS